jgi:hypothetical protein
MPMFTLTYYFPGEVEFESSYRVLWLAPGPKNTFSRSLATQKVKTVTSNGKGLSTMPRRNDIHGMTARG